MGRLPLSAKIDSSSNNIPTSFGTGAGSLILSGLANACYTHIVICNETATRIKVATATATPASSTSAMFYVPANSNVVLDDFSVSDNVYLESDASAISSGTVEATVW